MKKEFVKWVAVVSSAAMLTGSTMGVVQARTTNSPTVIKMWYPWGGIDEKVLKERIAAFEKLHSDIQIQATLIQGAGVSNGKFSTAVASGNPPDLVLYNAISQTAQFAAQGALTDITAQAKAAGISPSQFFPGYAHYMTYQGHIYGVPSMGANYANFLANKAVLKAAGVNPNFVPKTISDLLKAASKIDKKGSNGSWERIGWAPEITTTDPSGNPAFWGEYFGAKLFAPDGRTPIFNKEPGFIETVKWLKSFVDKYGANTIKQYNAEYNNQNILSSKQNPFYQGKLGFIVDGSWVGAYGTQFIPKFDMAQFAIPPVKAGQPPYIDLESDVLWFPRGAHNIPQSLEFVKFWDAPKNTANYGDQDGGMADTPQGAALQKTAHDPLFEPIFQSLSTGRTYLRPNTPDSQWGQILNQAVYNILYNNANLQQSLDSAAAQIAKLYTKK